MTSTGAPVNGASPELSPEQKGSQQLLRWERILGALLRSWKAIVRRMILQIGVLVVVLLLIPNEFRTVATIMPDTGKSRAGLLASLPDLASLAGVNVSGEQFSARLYPTILLSESVLGPVLLRKYASAERSDSADLISLWGISEPTRELSYEMALKKIRNDLEITQDTKTFVVALSIKSREGKLSADILNSIVQSMDEFIRTKQKTSASEQRKWIEGRLAEVSRQLETAENQLRDFRERNRIVESPRLLLQRERLLRDVTLNSTLSIELKRQYEIARIEEVKNVPIVNVLDEARPPVRHTSPRRTVTAIYGALFLLALNLAFVAAQEIYGSPSLILREHVNRIRALVS